MSRRAKYLEAAGVVRLRWQRGEPPKDRGPVLVEVWRSALDVGSWTQADRPHFSVYAKHECRVHVDGAWRVLRWNGLGDVEPGKVRRWAPMGNRHWWGNLTLDGWSAEDTD